ncbi:MAG: hypothetical protein P4M11_15395, partial [Candidatus Pacebacteria bacterium]|nr:hypothetical protein [Candidatus Paceibacterota bacterium]
MRSLSDSGATECSHRARLLPLPFVADAVCAASLRSARSRQRWSLHRLIIDLSNRCITTLNSMYPVDNLGPVHVFNSSRLQPGNSPSPRLPSATQSRLLAHLRQQCAAFVKTARIRRSNASNCDIDLKALIADAFLQAGTEPSEAPSAGDHHSHPHFIKHAPSSSLYSTASMPVVPLIASRVSLPDALQLVQLDSVLPPDVAAIYSTPHSDALMRDPLEVQLLNFTRPLKPARVCGARSEYVRLVSRLLPLGMVGFTRAPKAVNGVFTVAKDTESDRLIIDAQPANRLFIDSPSVVLPNASHLVQLQVPPDTPVYIAKSDLSNMYHHFALPEWMQPFFALPPLTVDEQRQLGLPVEPGVVVYPMCLTLPMGFSHAVHIAQTGHVHI